MAGQVIGWPDESAVVCSLDSPVYDIALTNTSFTFTMLSSCFATFYSALD